MKFREHLIRWLMPKEQKQQYASAADIISTLYSALGATGYSPTYTYSDLVAKYASWVFTSVDKISKSIAGAPKRVYAYKNKSDGKYIRSTEFKSYLRSSITFEERARFLKEVSKTVERVEITDNPLVDLLNKPNHVDVPFVFWSDLMIRLELSGSCGIYKVKGKYGVPSELWALPTSENGDFKPIPDKKLVISGYKYSDGDIQQNFTLDEAFWIHYPHPKNKYEGMSALKAQMDPYSIDYYLMRQQTNFFKNNAFVGNTLWTDQQLSKDQVTDLKALLVDQQSGVTNAGKWLLLHSGLKPDKLNSGTARDLMIQELGKIVQDKMLSAYGVNEGMVGLTAGQNRANLDASRENYFIECCGPRVMLLCQEFERGLVDEFDERMEIAIELPEVQQRELDIAERNTNLTNAVTTINEERAKMKMEPVSWGESPFIPFNLTQYGAKKKPEAEPFQGGDGGDEKSRRTMLWKEFDENSKRYEPQFSAIMRQIFREQSKEVINNLEAEGVKIKGNIAGFGKQKIREWLSEHKDKTDKINIDREKWKKMTADALTPAYKHTLLDAGRTRMRNFKIPWLKAGYSIDFNVMDTHIVKWLGSKLRRVSKEVTGTTFDNVEKVLEEGFKEGTPLYKISQELRESFATAEQYRADLIARTEAASTYNKGDLEGARQAVGDKVKKFWINEPDARDTHIKAGEDYSEDNAIDLDEKFNVGGDSMEVPGGGSDAGENVNCRCTLGYKKAEE